MVARAITGAIAAGALVLVSAQAQETATVRSGDLEGYVALASADRARIAERIAGSTMNYTFEEADLDWRFHRGDLTVDGHLINEHALIIDGDLIVDGVYDDYASSSGGVLIVLGDLRATHVFTWYGLWVGGAIHTDGLLYGTYNDWATEANGVVAGGVVMNDHAADLGAVTAAFSLYDGWDEEIEGAIRHLVPDVFTHLGELELGEPGDDVALGGYALYPDYETAKARAWNGEALLRTPPAKADLITALRRALSPSAREDQLVALIGVDPLVDRAIAARPALPNVVIDRLLDDPNADTPTVEAQADDRRTANAVRALLAGQVTDVTRLGGVGAATPEVAARLVANPDTDDEQLRALASASDPAVRRTLIDREDLPVDLLERLATDVDPTVRTVVGRDDNGARMTHDTLVRLATDPEVAVREATAWAHLPHRAATVLADDDDPEVRLALAHGLNEQIDHPNPRILLSERQTLATTLFERALAEGDAVLQTAAFLVLPGPRQLAIFEGTRTNADAVQVDWDDVAERAIHGPLLAALHEHFEDNFDLHAQLADNAALPVAVQIALVERAQAAGTTCETCWRAETPDDVLEILAGNDNLAPAALRAAADLVVARPRASFVDAVTGAWGMPPAVLETLDGALRGSEDWALSVVLQPHAARALLAHAIPRWYDDSAISKQLAALRRQDDIAWWHALATSRHDELRETAARSVHTVPEDLMRLLADDDPDIYFEVCRNPRVPEDRFGALEARGLDCLLVQPGLDADTVARLAQEAPTLGIRERARARYRIEVRRRW